MYPLRTEDAMTSRVSSLLACAGLLASVLKATKVFAFFSKQLQFE
jgi:hypothetical protein